MGKFRGWAQNSMCRGKLWSLVMMLIWRDSKGI